MKPLHPCGVPSCPTLTRNARCPAHTVTREERNPKDPKQQQFYGSTRWKATRSIIRKRDPICKMCHRRPTTQVHHKDNDWQNNDPSNLEGVCKWCHLEHSGREQRKKQAS